MYERKQRKASLGYFPVRMLFCVIRPTLWSSWRVNKYRAYWDYTNITSTPWLLTDAHTIYHGYQCVLCLQQWKKLWLVLNLSAWLSCLVRWSANLAHHSVPLHGAQPTARSLVTIQVLVISFPFIIKHSHLMRLISWLTFPIFNFSEFVEGAAQAPVRNVTKKEREIMYTVWSKHHLTAFPVYTHTFVLL